EKTSVAKIIVGWGLFAVGAVLILAFLGVDIAQRSLTVLHTFPALLFPSMPLAMGLYLIGRRKMMGWILIAYGFTWSLSAIAMGAAIAGLLPFIIGMIGLY